MLTGLRYNINSDMKIAMLDVGQGDSIVMHTKEGMNVLFDGGSTSKKNVGRYTIYTYLKYCGVRSLDYVFISHPDKDHVNGIYELIELCDNTFEIGTVVLPGISRAAAVKKQADDDMSKLERILKMLGLMLFMLMQVTVLNRENSRLSVCTHARVTITSQLTTILLYILWNMEIFLCL